MTNKMKDHLPKIDMEKMQRLLEIENQYESGQISLEEAHKLMREKVGTVRPYHLAYVEQTLKPETEDECIRVDMRKVIDLMDGFMDNSRPELPADHPIAHYYKENDEMRKLLQCELSRCHIQLLLWSGSVSVLAEKCLKVPQEAFIAALSSSEEKEKKK